MDDSIGLRLLAAKHITAGALIGLAGSFVGSAVGAGGGPGSTVLGLAVWIGFLFVAVVVALEGIVVLTEELLRADGASARSGLAD